MLVANVKKCSTPTSRGDRVRLPESACGVTAVKFRHPDGCPRELIHFPNLARKGKGVLGIDHNAVVAADINTSVALYVKLRHGATLNRGPTRVALDGWGDV